MSDSILTNTKKVLGIAEEYTAFDFDVMMHINSVFSTLQQLGVGPEEGFEITGDGEEWQDFLDGDKRLNNVKTYVYLRVRLLFDPPTTSYLIDALDKQRQELEWRINSYREETQWVDPDPDIDEEAV